ncbi:hypothetical protein HanPI659440_Chr09g0314961 [Helianthus annuus]|nr:hypothetical protein HanPI659440_Chr09g0314961 [Helianthus annuus]
MIVHILSQSGKMAGKGGKGMLAGKPPAAADKKKDKRWMSRSPVSCIM